MQTMPALSDGSEAAGADRKSQRCVSVSVAESGRLRETEKNRALDW
jgi:hypothetical protein